MKQLTFLVKPSSSLCNLRCRYCFYEDVASHRKVPSYGLMSLETAEKLVRSAFDSVDDNGAITFVFQGGEPTLIGLSFFERFLELEQRYKKPNVTVYHTIQTNGFGLDEQWASFFSKNHFLVGLSVDGTKEIHDSFRIDGTHSGTWKSVTKCLQIFQKYNVSVNLLCVVTKSVARNPQKVYRSLKKLGATYLQFIPCLDPLDGERGRFVFSLSADAYGSFLCGLFDAWYLDWKNGTYTSIRLFEDYIHLMLGQPSGTCATSGHCGSYLVVESDGSLYPCDFYVLDKWRIGNIKDVSPKDACFHNTAMQFLSDGEERPPDCYSCPWFPICRGGCKRDWHVENGITKNYFCKSFLTFFSYAERRLHEIAKSEYHLIHCTHSGTK